MDVVTTRRLSPFEHPSQWALLKKVYFIGKLIGGFVKIPMETGAAVGVGAGGRVRVGGAVESAIESWYNAKW